MADQPNGGIIPGLTKQGESVLRLVVREEVAAGIKAASCETCIRDCPRVDNLESTVYGTEGSRDGGLKGRMTTVEEQIGNLVWWHRATLVAALGAVGAVVVSLVK
ncbi:MAG: hypothetical protein GX595_16530 [Lentisphaerae bacterium]|nr:hypothetical protein [Lentisphaerota bacterium]